MATISSQRKALISFHQMCQYFHQAWRSASQLPQYWEDFLSDPEKTSHILSVKKMAILTVIGQPSFSVIDQPSFTVIGQPSFTVIGQMCRQYHQSVNCHWLSKTSRGIKEVPSNKDSAGCGISLRYISKKHYEFPELLESDLEEQFVRGSGPGGQSVNKTSNCVVLKHRPSGLMVKCHETRSLDTNRKIARQKLRELLDVEMNREKSFTEQQRREDSISRKTKKIRAKKNLERKLAFKEREGRRTAIVLHCVSAMAAKFVDVKPDRFQCITLDVGKQTFADTEDFQYKLKGSLDAWKSSGIRGVSVKIPTKQCSVVSVCAEFDFEFHHAQPGYVMMNRWLLEDEPSQLPEYANQYMGAGGFVVNDRQQLLVVKEKFTKNPHWKLPGGHVNKGEDITEACQREVLEETGVPCQFVSILSFRHQHGYRFGCSDVYFVCLMRPISEEINACEKEIADCQWMNLREFHQQENLSEALRFFTEQYLKQRQAAGKHQLVPSSVLSLDKKKYNNIYGIQTLD
ncbi:uncharacterized protein LOC135477040 [Liolophura sinensis]|uniref:uncharacterized protein LOC135477040 n=1 Tax=Liolophura sinensis TaxID=3198878 RepID=UPI003158BCC6